MSITQSTAGAGGGELTTGTPERLIQRLEHAASGGLFCCEADREEAVEIAAEEIAAALASAPPAGQGNGEASAERIIAEACKPWEFAVGEPPEWGSPLHQVFVAGMVYSERLLAGFLDVETYEAGDGSEDFDADATKSLQNILTAAGLYDPEEGVKATLASAPPAPTPDAGGDLAKLSAAATQGEWSIWAEKILGAHDAIVELKEQVEQTRPVGDHLYLLNAGGKCPATTGCGPCSEANAAFIVALVNAYRSGRLVETPPGEDLAGQGEPVAWAYEWLDPFNNWWRPRSRLASEGRPPEKAQFRNIRPLYAAPAPSRPADREEIATELCALAAKAHDAALLADSSEARFEQLGRKAAFIAAQQLVLALRDAPRTGGDGWRPASTAPTNRAVQVYIPRLDYYGNDGVYAGMLVDMGTGQHWMTFAWAMGRDMTGDNAPTHWRPLPGPPSPNAGDGTLETQGGGR